MDILSLLFESKMKLGKEHNSARAGLSVLQWGALHGSTSLKFRTGQQRH